MNPVTDLEPIGDLQEIFLADSLNILRNIKATFETRTRRDAAVNHDTSTLDKCALMELTSMLLGTGHKPAASMLDMVQYVFHDGLVAIRATPDPVATMSRLIEMTAPGQRQKLFSLHWTTVDGATPDMDRTQVDELLKMNYASCIEELDRPR
jgi:zona occludens toxin (predicted ATPase)